MRLSVFLLCRSLASITQTFSTEVSILELVRLLLPGPIALDPYADAAENHLLPAPEVDTKLHNISILHGIQPRRHVRLAQPHVIQKRPRRAPDILNMPLTVQV